MEPDDMVMAVAEPERIGTGNEASGSLTAWAAPSKGDGVMVAVVALETAPTTWMELARSFDVPVSVTAGEVGELTTTRPGTSILAEEESASLPVGLAAEAEELVI
jgi:hypothetical protein